MIAVQFLTEALIESLPANFASRFCTSGFILSPQNLPGTAPTVPRPIQWLRGWRRASIFRRWRQPGFIVAMLFWSRAGHLFRIERRFNNTRAFVNFVRKADNDSFFRFVAWAFHLRRFAKSVVQKDFGVAFRQPFNDGAQLALGAAFRAWLLQKRPNFFGQVCGFWPSRRITGASGLESLASDAAGCFGVVSNVVFHRGKILSAMGAQPLPIFRGSPLTALNKLAFLDTPFVMLLVMRWCIRLEFFQHI